MYVKVENNHIIQEVDRPAWYFDDGKPVTDEWLVENENIFPVVDDENKPTVTPGCSDYEFIVMNPLDEWIIDRDNKKVIKTFTKVIKTLDEMKNLYFEKVKVLRTNYENGGMTFIDSNNNTLKIQTDRSSRSNLTSAFIAAQNNLREENSLWKTIDGFVAISNADIIDLAQQVLSFIQTCFNNEKSLQDKIKNVDHINALSRINLQDGWPNNSLFSEMD